MSNLRLDEFQSKPPCPTSIHDDRADPTQPDIFFPRILTGNAKVRHRWDWQSVSLRTA